MIHRPSPRQAAKLHRTLAIAWALLVVPTLLFWKNSILWVAFMSLYANVAGHWSAYQAAQAESRQQRQERRREGELDESNQTSVREERGRF